MVTNFDPTILLTVPDSSSVQARNDTIRIRRIICDEINTIPIGDVVTVDGHQVIYASTIYLDNAPTLSNQAATKQYVDDAVFGASSVRGRDVYTVSGSWNLPAGKTWAEVRLFGGGGGGGASSGSTAGGGGGSGGYVRWEIPNALLVNPINYTIGAGGLGGTSGSAGTNGGVSSVECGGHILYAWGGGGGQVPAGGAGAGTGSGANGTTVGIEALNDSPNNQAGTGGTAGIGPISGSDFALLRRPGGGGSAGTLGGELALDGAAFINRFPGGTGGLGYSGAGAGGPGGPGADGSPRGVSAAGISAAVGSGAGGGGGAPGVADAPNNGGNGGSGAIVIEYM